MRPLSTVSAPKVANAFITAINSGFLANIAPSFSGNSVLTRNTTLIGKFEDSRLVGATPSIRVVKLLLSNDH